jgi:hypothetical protein
MVARRPKPHHLISGCVNPGVEELEKTERDITQTRRRPWKLNTSGLEEAGRTDAQTLCSRP